ncbi:hypothetical protein [Massilia sp. PWRC2]|uniref:hypothetical protein n=1 Tax=Massilia sp. PWRC2 TaxID=2804626 RepID=UPI003CEA6E19
MKSVSLSPVVPVQWAPRLPHERQSWRPLAALALAVSSGLALIAALMMHLDPTAPAAWIVIPVLLGGSLPLLAVLPGRFDVHTRFDAAHFVNTLDRTLGEMGYISEGCTDPRTRSYRRRSRLPHWNDGTIALTVHAHAITVGGPLPALRQLQQRLSV